MQASLNLLDSQTPPAGHESACAARVQEVALPNGAPADVDREFVLSFSIMDEVKSFFYNQNLAALGAGLTNGQQTALAADDDGAANEHFHGINGDTLAIWVKVLSRIRDTLHPDQRPVGCAGRQRRRRRQRAIPCHQW